MPHTPGPGPAPAAAPLNMPHKDLTVVRIPLRRAKHHFGAASARGTRSYNEDTNQAGTIDMPAFAKRAPISLQRRHLQKPNEATSAVSTYGDPQIFYFGVFDGHGGAQCSDFLRDELHGYIEQAAIKFGLQSSLEKRSDESSRREDEPETGSPPRMRSDEEVKDDLHVPTQDEHGRVEDPDPIKPLRGVRPVAARLDKVVLELESL